MAVVPAGVCEDSEPIEDPVGAADARFRSLRVSARGAQLRVLEWLPVAGGDCPTLVLVAGWISIASGWGDFLRALVPHRRVLFYESREKRSARLPQASLTRKEFAPQALAEDLLSVCSTLQLEPDRTILFGSSLGATTILEACKRSRRPAAGAFLVGPTCRFRFPWWSEVVLLWPPAAYRLVLPFVLWYLRHYRVDSRREPEQMRRYESTLRSADPSRLKLSAYALRGFEVWPGVETISVPTAVAWAPSDTLHSEAEIHRLLAALPEGRPVTASSNRALHDRRIVGDLITFESALGL